jgi:hypothetical protein
VVREVAAMSEPTLPFAEPEPARPAPARATVDGRDALPELATRPLGRRLRVAPKSSPRSDETVMVKARRGLINEPGRWIELSTRHTLSEAAARRLVASLVRAKPARLDPDAAGSFLARAYQRNNRWHVAAAYQPPPDDGSGRTSSAGVDQRDGAGRLRPYGQATRSRPLD